MLNTKKLFTKILTQMGVAEQLATKATLIRLANLRILVLAGYQGANSTLAVPSADKPSGGAIGPTMRTDSTDRATALGYVSVSSSNGYVQRYYAGAYRYARDLEIKEKDRRNNMEKVTLSFSAKGQSLTGWPFKFASNTVNYIEAKFELGENWGGFDSVRAVWFTDFNCISTVLDTDGVCVVPHEVLNKAKREVKVNLVGSIVENGELTDRLTTYPIKAIIIDANAKICGSETAEVTPSQFEQYIAIVEQLVGSVKDIDHTTLNADYTLTIYYTDGTSDTVGPIRGAQGETGNGILSAVLNPDYTLTLNYTNGQHDTVGPIRGAKGETGNGIQSIYLTGTSGAVKTYTILFTDGNTTEFQVTDGEVTNAVLESLMPTDTANGSIASFPDGQNVFPLKSLVAEINPIQDLHGYNSPWVGGAGKNLLDETEKNVIGGTVQYLYTNGYTLLVNQAYTFSTSQTAAQITIKDFSSGDALAVKYGNSQVTYTPSADTKVKLELYYNTTYPLPSGGADSLASMLEEGSTATTYEPYSNICPISGHTEVDVVVSPTTDAEDGTTYTTALGQTVYGGTLDLVSGVLTVNYSTTLKEFDGSADEGWGVAVSGGHYRAYCIVSDIKSFTDGFAYVSDYYVCDSFPNDSWENVFAGKTVMGMYETRIGVGIDALGITNIADWNIYLSSHPITIAYELATPTTYQLTPQQIQTLLGQNNVWADSGDVEVVYIADIKLYVDNH